MAEWQNMSLYLLCTGPMTEYVFIPPLYRSNDRICLYTSSVPVQWQNMSFIPPLYRSNDRICPYTSSVSVQWQNMSLYLLGTSPMTEWQNISLYLLCTGPMTEYVLIPPLYRSNARICLYTSSVPVQWHCIVLYNCRTFQSITTVNYTFYLLISRSLSNPKCNLFIHSFKIYILYFLYQLWRRAGWVNNPQPISISATVVGS